MKTIIEKDKYSGYLWYSDQSAPRAFQDSQVELVLDDESNPFVIEGQLCNNVCSYSIKYIDGHYFLKRYDKATLQNVEKSELSYLPNFKAEEGQKPIEGLKFIQYWRPQIDPLCGGTETDEGMLVLQPAEFVFDGFKYKEE